MSLEAGAKVQLLFNLASVLKSFLKIYFLHSFHLRFDNLSTPLSCIISKNLTPLRVGKDKTFFLFWQDFFWKFYPPNKLAIFNK
ncbi:hypothetical protein DB895_02970 [Flavobacterium psychrotolerans]|uniref:Uncharacterized protein n=1 Tax=Flavobacterium psychrotolerans TaxID=2169410 RepID=A0A2U1JML1_9FLAO|nr:hypothetical protein DB895_02970 [Flavobacterium psychrotolerans]